MVSLHRHWPSFPVDDRAAVVVMCWNVANILLLLLLLLLLWRRRWLLTHTPLHLDDWHR